MLIAVPSSSPPVDFPRRRLALSPSLQEIFAAVAIKRTADVEFVAVGAGLDFIAGTQTRCPLLLPRLNLEWA
jgi:UDP-N-acetyl-D-mannosaminuronic acid transferase (WecB/TagA/CpsF family)